MSASFGSCFFVYFADSFMCDQVKRWQSVSSCEKVILHSASRIHVCALAWQPKDFYGTFLFMRTGWEGWWALPCPVSGSDSISFSFHQMTGSFVSCCGSALFQIFSMMSFVFFLLATNIIVITLLIFTINTFILFSRAPAICGHLCRFRARWFWVTL